eukprot:TRINITY_DN48290_c0_g1_i1.p1 TRINITY_DN48290_c0_g1~~TRINITY_DN48290_c0_g1_i1.p1  ORF type:complete len:483 (-),score=96.97 TRINITY_DN48290_c0_g1_i1:78-1526(-)
MYASHSQRTAAPYKQPVPVKGTGKVSKGGKPKGGLKGKDAVEDSSYGPGDMAERGAMRDLCTFHQRGTQQFCQGAQVQLDSQVQKAETLRQQNSMLAQEIDQLTAQVAELERQLSLPLSERQPLMPASTGWGVGHAAGHMAVGSRNRGDVSAQSESFVEVQVCQAHAAAVAVNSEAQVFVTASWDGKMHVRRLVGNDETGFVRSFDPNSSGSTGGFTDVAFGKTINQSVACASQDHNVYLWKMWHSTPDEKPEVFGVDSEEKAGHTDEVNGLDFHPTQHMMSSTSKDGLCLLWDYEVNTLLRTLNHEQEVRHAAFFGSQRYQYNLATICQRQVKLWDMRQPQLVTAFGEQTDELTGMAEHDGALATSSDDGTVCLWDARNWKPWTTLNTRAINRNWGQREDETWRFNSAKQIAFSEDGELLAVACSSNSVLVYGMGRIPTLEDKLVGHTDCVCDVAWGTRNGTRILVSASHDGTARVWQQNW